MKVGDYVRRTVSNHHLGKITKVNRKTVWVETGWFEERLEIKDLVLLKWNDTINRWEDA